MFLLFCSSYAPVRALHFLVRGPVKLHQTRTTCHPGAMLSWMADRSSAFARRLIELHQDEPSSPERPWRILLYADEIGVGNLLRVDNTRKTWAIYWGVLELGPQTLSHEIAWMLLGVLRHNISAKVQGGFSGALKEALLALFFRRGMHATQDGFFVRSNGSIMTIFLKLHCILADDDAIRVIWKTKGASGNVNCHLCRNVTRVGSRLIDHDDSGVLVDATEADVSLFIQHSDVTFFEAVDRLARTPACNMKEEERATGMNHDPFSLPSCRVLRPDCGPVSVTLFDVAHVFIISGLCHFQVSAFMQRAKSCNVKYEHFHLWFQSWNWPRFDRNPPKRLFNATHAAHDCFKVSVVSHEHLPGKGKPCPKSQGMFFMCTWRDHVRHLHQSA